MEDTGSDVIVEVFLDLNRFEIYSIIERLFNIVLSMLKDFEMVLENRSGEICSSIMVRENEVDKLHFLALRLLNHLGGRGRISTMDATNYRSVVRTIERISDHISHMSEAMLNIETNHPEISPEVKIARDILRRAMVAFFKKDRHLAEEVLESAGDFTNKILKFYENILNLDVVAIMNIKTVLDSLIRVASYSADIAEIAINMSVYERHP
nr:phosphate uptake regulator PhoU [Archaeoglobus neptunius]